jgi:hypothetical protein
MPLNDRGISDYIEAAFSSLINSKYYFCIVSLKSIYHISELYIRTGLTRDSNNFLYILIDTLSNGERYLNIENKILAPFLDNSVNEEFKFPEASIIFPRYLYLKTFSSLIPLRKKQYKNSILNLLMRRKQLQYSPERVSIKIYKKLFESLVKPVLMYNSEIWYMDFNEKISNAFNRAQNNDLNNFDMLSFIDKSPTNLRFCKYVLGLACIIFISILSTECSDFERDKASINKGLFPSLEILAKYFSDCTLMKTSTGYWACSALAAILTDCLLNPNTYLQNLKFVGLLSIKLNISKLFKSLFCARLKAKIILY